MVVFVMSQYFRYLSVDFRRLLKNPKFIIGILGVTAMLFFSLEDSLFREGFGDGAVIFTYYNSVILSGFLIAYSFCALPFATIYPEDWEHKYIRYSLIRGSLKAYVAAKATVIYISALLAMIIGTLIFLLICRTQVPWVNPELGDSFEIFLQGNYSHLLKDGHVLLYCILFSIHLGFIAGFLANMASCCSVIISNTVLTLIFPALAYRMLCFVSIKGYSILSLTAITKIFPADWSNLLFMLGISVVISALSAMGCYLGLKRKL